MKRLIIAILIVCLFCVGTGWTAEKLPIYVSILPQKYFLEKIGGDLVDVSVMVQPGASPATYEPSPRQMGRLSKALAYFSIGVPFERVWLKRIAAANKDMVIIPTDAGIHKIAMAEHHHEDEHGHDDHGESEDDGRVLDPHIWLSPEFVHKIARNIYKGLAKLDPENKSIYQANLDAFIAEVVKVDGDIRKELTVVPGNKRTFMVFHPSWGYFAHQYGLKQVAIEAEGKSPSPRDLVEIVEHGRELGVSVVFVQPQFSARSAKVIASEIGAQVVPLDPLGLNWDSNMRSAAKAFRDALR